ncbi:hypothetical protein MSG28_002522 [Choristoneura fumiferana]|uniref:Uncharacterized protein n=1 Tax=Choristoneura fumiferana TaxID=7141 RepID=A0ACC0JW28_CHOFU|nr:hypothetical protein MSG28_002522 [Choristoneura fumiferana]
MDDQSWVIINLGQTQTVKSVTGILVADAFIMGPIETGGEGLRRQSTSFFSMFSNSNLRTRRHSGSFSPLASPHTANSCGPRAPRVTQLRAEECADATRELAHEREVHCAMQLGQSCEDLTLPGLANSPTRVTSYEKCERAFAPILASCALSRFGSLTLGDTKGEVKCSVIAHLRFPPVVSPSPTRKYTTRRSLSPIAIRASSFSPVGRGGALAGKRRCDEPDSPLPKRMCTDRLTPSTPGTPDSDSLECTFRPVSPRAQPMNDSPNDSHQNHKSTNPS